MKGRGDGLSHLQVVKRGSGKAGKRGSVRVEGVGGEWSHLQQVVF